LSIKLLRIEDTGHLNMAWFQFASNRRPETSRYRITAPLHQSGASFWMASAYFLINGNF